MPTSCKPLSDRERAKTGSGHARKRRQLAAKQRPTTDPWSLTFPDRLKRLAEKFYQQALVHPAFMNMSQIEIRQSIENRLWSIVHDYPCWWGHGPIEKTKATPEQIERMRLAREAKRALNADYTPAAGTLQEA
jgi:hypothetical protein